MNRFFGRELYIRLAENEPAFVCTTTYGKLFSRAKRVLLNREREVAAEDSTSMPSKKRHYIQSLSLLQNDADEVEDE
jgi:hypothetical protein